MFFVNTSRRYLYVHIICLEVFCQFIYFCNERVFVVRAITINNNNHIIICAHYKTHTDHVILRSSRNREKGDNNTGTRILHTVNNTVRSNYNDPVVDSVLVFQRQLHGFYFSADDLTDLTTTNSAETR